MKIAYISILILLSIVSSSLAKNDTHNNKSSFEFNLGYSRYYADPDVSLNLSGITGDVRWLLGKKDLVFLSKNLHKIREITFSFSKVFNGNIDASALGLSYGPRYEFQHLYLGFGFSPYSYLLFSNNKTDALSGFSLDTGFRLHVYYLVGFKYSAFGRIMTMGIKYNFTIKDVYWHNPFAPHKHEDVFHYFTINIGVRN
jgi:hypothetical protein